MKIGIDLDDTINNLVETWLTKYNYDYEDTVSINDIKSWDLHKYVSCGNDIYNYLRDGFLFKALGIKKGAVEAIDELMKEHEVYIVTANAHYNYGVCDDKIDFIKEEIPNFPIENLIFANNKHMIDLDILIDDGLHNLEGFCHYYPIVFDRPWNRSNDIMSRIYSWDNENLDKLKSIIYSVEKSYEWN